MEKIINLLNRLNIQYKNLDYYIEAFTHPSYLNEKHIKGNSYQKLEFLGDAIFEFVVSDYIFQTYKDKNEGDLTFIRQNSVQRKSFAKVARELNLGECFLLGNGEEKSGARNRDSLLEDSLEAFVAAMYLDLGMDVTRSFIVSLIKDDITDTKDNKSTLQEFLQRSVEYRLDSEKGPSHDKIFVCSVYVDEVCLGTGQGKTKKAAEQEAAKMALAILASK